MQQNNKQIVRLPACMGILTGLMIVLAVVATAQTNGSDASRSDANNRWIERGWAHFQALDKVTARISDIYVAVSDKAQFQAISITVHACFQRPPEDTPESATHIVINERRLNDEVTQIFEGWMFASSPGTHSLEHPVYDVWIRGCLSEVPEPLLEGSAPNGSR